MWACGPGMETWQALGQGSWSRHSCEQTARDQMGPGTCQWVTVGLVMIETRLFFPPCLGTPKQNKVKQTNEEHKGEENPRWNKISLTLDFCHSGIGEHRLYFL